MTDQVNVVSKTQTIEVEEASGTVAVINSGPQGPSGPYAASQTIETVSGTTYTIVNTDVNKLKLFSNAGAIAVTAPQDSDVTWEIGSWVELLQYGTGQITVAAGTGATLISTPTLKSRATNSRLFLQKIAANTWHLSGDLAAV